MPMLSMMNLFKGLTEGDLEKIGSIVEERTVASGVKIFGQGEPATAVYILQRGSVRVIRNEGGEARELTQLCDGDFFGEMGCINNAPRNADVVAIGDCELLVLSKDAFMHLLATNPNISRRVMAATAKRCRPAIATQAGSPLPVPVPVDATAAPRPEDTPAAAPAPAGPRPATVIGFFSASGGVGTTFVAGNLAGALRQLTGKKVLVVDLDLMFGDQGVLFDVDSEKGIESLEGKQQVNEQDLLLNVLPTKSDVDVLLCPSHPEKAEAIDLGLLIAALDVLRQHYDYIVLDTANVVQEFSLNLLEMVQVPIYILTADFFGLKNLSRWFTLMRKLQFPTDRVELIFNKHEETDRTAIELITKKFNKAPLGLVPLERLAAKASVESGRLAVVDDPQGAIGRAVRAIAGKVAGLQLPEEQEPFWKRWIGL